MRKLAAIQKVVSVEPIPDSDRIEKVTVLGWEIVSKKGDFKPGTLCVYVEVDSILPDRPEFEFMRERKFRVKTIKLRGQVSQGICFPINILPKDKYYTPGIGWDLATEGDDVTEILGILKYDPQGDIENANAERRNVIHNKRLNKYFNRYKWYRHLFFKPVRAPFPSWIKKTDEDRIQLFPNICQEQKGVAFDMTEKIDGQSATYFVIKNRHRKLWQPEYMFGVCSRRFQLLRSNDSSYWTIAKQLDIKNKMLAYVKKHPVALDMAIQGEILGQKIQDNKYHLEGYRFRIFNFFINGQYYNHCPIYNELTHVPYIRRIGLPDTIPEAVEMSKGQSVLADIPREGVVLRTSDGSASFKIVNPDFLLQYGD